MGIITEPWNDTNRFNQTSYSGPPTLFPIESNYIDKQAFKADLSAAEYRETNHQEFLDELRMEAQQEAYCKYYGCEENDY